jgi:hypothetical protein
LQLWMALDWVQSPDMFVNSLLLDSSKLRHVGPYHFCDTVLSSAWFVRVLADEFILFIWDPLLLLKGDLYYYIYICCCIPDDR